MPTEISPWVEKLSPYRQAIAAGAVLVVLIGAIAWLAYRWNVANDRLALLQQQADAGFLQAPSTSRTVRIDLHAPRAVSVGGVGFPERVDLLVNARTDRYARFRMSLLRDDGTLIVHADRDASRLEQRSSPLVQLLDPAGRRLPRPRRRLPARGRDSVHCGSAADFGRSLTLPLRRPD
jgi:hypothetical protein